MAAPIPEVYDPAVGYVAVPDLLVEPLRSEILAWCADLLALPEAERHVRDKVGSGTHHLNELDRRCGPVTELLRDERLRDVVEEIVGPEPTLYQAHYRAPQPGFGAQRFHTDDLPKLTDGPDHVATMILALVDFTNSNGATRVLPGSHRRVDLQQAPEAQERNPDQLTLAGQAGTGFIFSEHLLHSGTRNDSNRERPALQVVWRRASRL